MSIDQLFKLLLQQDVIIFKLEIFYAKVTSIFQIKISYGLLGQLIDINKHIEINIWNDFLT